MLSKTSRFACRSLCQAIKTNNAFQQSQNYSIGVIGAPFWNGQPKPGTEHGPDGLRGAGLLKRISDIGTNVADFGNLNFHPKSANKEIMMILKEKLNNRSEYLLIEMCNELSKFVGALCDTGFIPLILGGDHSIAVGSVFGVTNSEKYRGKEISLIWVDAHADLNTEASSESGNLHGMPVSFLLKNCITPKRESLKNFVPTIEPKNVVYVGLRDVEIAELKMLQHLNIKYYSMCDVDKFGIDKVMEMALDHVSGPNGQNPLHVSFDIDSVDATITGSTGTAVPGGLTLREALRIAEIVYETRRMIALDMVEFNPLIGTADDVQKTARATIEIILSFLGKSRLGEYHVCKEKHN